MTRWQEAIATGCHRLGGNLQFSAVSGLEPFRAGLASKRRADGASVANGSGSLAPDNIMNPGKNLRI